jgi:caffeoyl-CoA O-methyltransferase
MILPSDIERYTESFSSSESIWLKTIRAKTAEHFSATQMISGPIVANVIQFILRISDARRALDIGTFTGYSASAIAEGLAALDSGVMEGSSHRKVITIEKSRESFEFAKMMIRGAPFESYIQFEHGEALTLLNSLQGTFDFIFMDADKVATREYYEWGIQHLRPQGTLLVDDVLWYGKVLDPSSDKRALAMHTFNQFLKEDSRVSHVLLPIRHGLQWIIKKP